jgi:hypothetical protein
VKPWLVAIAITERRRRARALAVGDALDRARGILGGERACLQRLGLDVARRRRDRAAAGAVHQPLLGGEPGPFVLGRLARHRDRALDKHVDRLALRSEVETLAERRPTNTRSPSSSLSERSTSSSAPIRTETDSDRSAANTASAASAPALRAPDRRRRGRVRRLGFSVSIAAT